jgi:SNF2 family DNA or RNA helicase
LKQQSNNFFQEPKMLYKTKPYAHQVDALRWADCREAVGFGMEQGTGKTKVQIDEAAHLYRCGKIDAVIIVAPNTVHRLWVTVQIPTHMHDSVPRTAVYWSKRIKAKEQESLFKGNDLKIIAFNTEAMRQDRAIDLMRMLLNRYRVLFVVDESHRFKNPAAVGTKELFKLAELCKYRRILTGTAMTQSPFDLWAQFCFLDPDILQNTSFVAFKCEYAMTMSPNSGFLKTLQKRGVQSAKFAVVVQRDINGAPMYRNLDKLQRLIEPYFYRVLKKDCLDLPDKIYSQIEFDLTPAQEKLYNSMRDQLRADLDGLVKKYKRQEIGGDKLIIQHAIAGLAKLQQITSNFIIDNNKTVRRIGKVNPRLEALLDSAEDIDSGGVIVWCRMKEEVHDVYEAVTKRLKKRAAMYYGDTKPGEREDIIKRFENRELDWFIGNPAAGGVGITLVAAETMYYYTNSFMLGDRLQSEDRAHRIGQTKNLRIIDISATGTNDEKIIQNLRNKIDVSGEIYRVGEWL